MSQLFTVYLDFLTKQQDILFEVRVAVCVFTYTTFPSQHGPLILTPHIPLSHQVDDLHVEINFFCAKSSVKEFLCKIGYSACCKQTSLKPKCWSFL